VADIFRAHIIDVTDASYIIEMTATATSWTLSSHRRAGPHHRGRPIGAAGHRPRLARPDGLSRLRGRLARARRLKQFDRSSQLGPPPRPFLFPRSAHRVPT